MAQNGQAARAARTRHAVLRAAADMLEKDGLEALTLRALGAAAEVSRAAPYRHFADKSALLAAVAAEGMRSLRESMIEAAQCAGAGAGPLDRLELMLVAYLDAALSRPAHYRLIFGGDVVTREHPELETEGLQTFELLLQAVTDAQAAALLPIDAPPLRLAALLWSSTHGLIDLLLSGFGMPEKGLDDPRALILLMLASLGGREHQWMAGDD